VFGRKPVPLAIDIDCILLDAWPDVPRWRVKRFLGDWCRSRSYLMALAAGGPRLFLDGSIDGEVAPDQQAHARDLLETRQARNLAAFQANLEANRQRRRERNQAAYDAAVAAYRAREAAKAPPAPPPPEAPTAAEAPQPSRPTLRLSSVQVRGHDRQTREVQVVVKRKFARSNGGAVLSR
jgi:sRNA-binding protein